MMNQGIMEFSFSWNHPGRALDSVRDGVMLGTAVVCWHVASYSCSVPFFR